MCAFPAIFIAPKLMVAATAEPMKGTKRAIDPVAIRTPMRLRMAITTRLVTARPMTLLPMLDASTSTCCARLESIFFDLILAQPEPLADRGQQIGQDAYVGDQVEPRDRNNGGTGRGERTLRHHATGFVADVVKFGNGRDHAVPSLCISVVVVVSTAICAKWRGWHPFAPAPSSVDQLLLGSTSLLSVTSPRPRALGDRLPPSGS